MEKPGVLKIVHDRLNLMVLVRYLSENDQAKQEVLELCKRVEEVGLLHYVVLVCVLLGDAEEAYRLHHLKEDDSGCPKVPSWAGHAPVLVFIV